jgi:hypothetical protein
MLNPMTGSEQSGTWRSCRDDLIFARARETPSHVHPRPRPPNAGSHNREPSQKRCKTRGARQSGASEDAWCANQAVGVQSAGTLPPAYLSDYRPSSPTDSTPQVSAGKFDEGTSSCP